MVFQLGSGLLDACVLAVLKESDAYGYSLTQNIKKSFPISETTLYPVLRRLEKDECLTLYDEPEGGRMRRYYKITEKGELTLCEYQKAWNDYKTAVDSLISGKGENKK